MTKRSLTKMATTALEIAVERVWEEHRKSGSPVAILENGRIEMVVPKARAKRGHVKTAR